MLYEVITIGDGDAGTSMNARPERKGATRDAATVGGRSARADAARKASAREPGAQPGEGAPGSAADGVLFVVGTPIGNLADMTFRAVDTLRAADP